MNFSLTPALEQFVRDRANSGDYNNASEVVREALRLLKRQDEHQALKLEQLRQAIREGDDALARGDYTDLKDDGAVDSFIASSPFDQIRKTTMSLYQQFGTNSHYEVDGTWFPFPQSNGSIVELKLARAGGENTGYKRELRRLLRRHQKARDIPLEQYKPAETELCQAIAAYVLLDWRTIGQDGKTTPTIQDENGKPLGYSETRAARLVQQLPELRSEILLKASDFTNFQNPDVLEDIEKN